MYKQIELPYAFNALEPHIDAATMETHYQKHHATYTKNFNELTEKAGIQNKPAAVILAHWKAKSEGKPEAQGIRNNGGGFYNHNLYFGHLAPGGSQPEGELAKAINASFGTLGEFKDAISKAAIGQFGSGWAWLSSDKDGKLTISATPNQDNPLLVTEGVQVPILGIDVWEHAYYLKYRNLRADYIKAFFEVVNWHQVAENYEKAKTADFQHHHHHEK